WFAVYVWRRVRSAEGSDHPLSAAFLKASLVSLVVSSVGPWSLALLSANGLAGTDWYDASIYLYLHFQYNGWLALGLIALMLRLLERKGVRYEVRLAKWQFWLYTGSLLPSLLSSLLWMDVGPVLTVIAG